MQKRRGHLVDGVPAVHNLRMQTGLFPMDYGQACREMDQMVQALKAGQGPEILWFLEHRPVYTFGARTDLNHVKMAQKTSISVQPSMRGGQMTFHGPGQRILYCILNLRQRKLGIHEYVDILQDWVIAALDFCGLSSWKKRGHVGVWTSFGKIASIGVRVSGGVSAHGMAINVLKSDGEFRAIVPCGLSDVTMSSIQDMKPDIFMQDLDVALMARNPFEK